MSTTARKVFACPREACDRTSDAPVYCRHGRAPGDAVGAWMVPAERDPTEDRADETRAFEKEVEDTIIALLKYAGSERREWIRQFELRTVGGSGKSMKAIATAYAQLVKNGVLEEGESDFVRLRPDGNRRRRRWPLDRRGSGGVK